MKLTDCRKMMFEFIAPELEKHGYKQNKKGWYGFKKTTHQGEINIWFTANSYGEVQYCHFTHGVIINSVENIFKKVNAKFSIDPAYNNSLRPTIYGYDYRLPNDELYSRPYAAKITEEREMREFLLRYNVFLLDNVILEFENFLFDLRKIDTVINSENFWEEDGDKGYSLSQGFFFVFRRTTIAYLCRNVRTNLLIDFHKKILGKSVIESIEFKERNQNILNAYNYLLEVLKETVPIY